MTNQARIENIVPHGRVMVATGVLEEVTLPIKTWNCLHIRPVRNHKRSCIDCDSRREMMAGGLVTSIRTSVRV